MKKPICVCIPCQDQVQAGFAFDLASMTGNWGSNHPDQPLHLVAIKGSILPGQRQRIALQAMEAKCSHMLWLDTDMRFPPDALDRLMDRNEDFVGCNYTTRRGEIRPTAIKIMNDELLYTNEDSTGLEAAAVIGFGVALIKTEIFEKISFPHFYLGWDPEQKKFTTGEDAYFCLKCWHELDVRPKVDHDLSKRVCHTGVMDYHHKHATKTPTGNLDSGEGF